MIPLSYLLIEEVKKWVDSVFRANFAGKKLTWPKDDSFSENTLNIKSGDNFYFSPMNLKIFIRLKKATAHSIFIFRL